MPESPQHGRQADEGESLAADLASDVHPFRRSWSTVLFFYSALHQVDRYLATKGFHPHTHRQRDGYISSWKDLKPIYTQFADLHDRCDEVRYDCYRFPAPAIEKFRHDLYEPIKSHMEKLCQK